MVEVRRAPGDDYSGAFFGLKRPEPTLLWGELRFQRSRSSRGTLTFIDERARIHQAESVTSDSTRRPRPRRGRPREPRCCRTVPPRSRSGSRGDARRRRRCLRPRCRRPLHTPVRSAWDEQARLPMEARAFHPLKELEARRRSPCRSSAVRPARFEIRHSRRRKSANPRSRRCFAFGVL